jgi:hypothetical protein
MPQIYFGKPEIFAVSSTARNLFLDNRRFDGFGFPSDEQRKRKSSRMNELSNSLTDTDCSSRCK